LIISFHFSVLFAEGCEWPEIKMTQRVSPWISSILSPFYLLFFHSLFSLSLFFGFCQEPISGYRLDECGRGFCRRTRMQCELTLPFYSGNFDPVLNWRHAPLSLEIRAQRCRFLLSFFLNNFISMESSG